MNEETQTSPISTEPKSNPLLNIGIIVGAIVFLGVAVFLYIRFDGKNARVQSSESQSESSVQLGSALGSVNEGQPAPDFSLSDASGKNYTLADFKGKPTLIVFEATWCTYCHQQNSDVEKLKKELGDKMNIVSVDVKEDLGTVLNAWQQRGNSRLVLLDTSGDVGGVYGIVSTPTNIFLDSNGTVHFKHPGLMGFDQMMEAFNNLS